MKVLFISVGGSFLPIVQSIRKHKPNFVYFFCTETKKNFKGSDQSVIGEGLVCEDRDTKEKYPNIVVQTNALDYEYEVCFVQSPDNPFGIYEQALKIIHDHIEKENHVVLDYTGGTKSMGVGLAAAGMEFAEVELSVVSGKRVDTIRVKSGMEKVSKLTVNKVYVSRQLTQWKLLFAKRDYEAAFEILENLSVSGKVDQENEEFERLYYLSKALSEWDKFQYANAAKLIALYKEDEHINPYNPTIQRIVSTIHDFEKNWSPDSKRLPPGSGYILVYDVLNNALRRADQGNYDDAVARIYRALEMYGQFCLMTNTPRFRSSEVEIDRLPEHLKNEYKERALDGKVSLPLYQTFDLLLKLGHPVAPIWERERKKIVDSLKVRNYSFLAHGMEPVTEQSFLEIKNRVWKFITDCDEALRFKEGLNRSLQLPNHL